MEQHKVVSPFAYASVHLCPHSNPWKLVYAHNTAARTDCWSRPFDGKTLVIVNAQLYFYFDHSCDGITYLMVRYCSSCGGCTQGFYNTTEIHAKIARGEIISDKETYHAHSQ